jgi:beta-lactamase superfamily II metal-dependent hydrolase
MTAVLLLNNANWFAAHLMLGILHISAALPGSYLYVAAPRLSRAPLCQLTVFDLADGGAIHVRADGYDWLLDCGDEAHYGRIVLPFLRSRGVNRLDGLLLTHGDVRHIGAALTAIADFRPRLLADSTLRDRSRTRNNVHTQLEQLRIGKGLYARDDWMHLGHGAQVRVLYPPLGLKRSVAADMALVLQLQAGHTRALLMSDSGFNTEQWLLENEPDLQSDIVIKGQHPSDLSGTPDFLARVAPRAVICGAPRYGQPIEQLDAWEKDIAAQGITIFRQDKTGAVTIEIQDDAWELRGYANGQTFRSRAR